MGRLFYRLPVANIFYDLLFDSHPDMTQLSNVMAALALMSGLLITMAGSLLISVSPEDCVTIQDRVETFMTEVDVKLLTGQVVNPYEQFCLYSALSFTSITASLISLLLMYLGVGTISFENSVGKESHMMNYAWWRWSRWIVVLDISLIAVGLTMTCIAHQYLFAMMHGTTPQRLADMIWLGDLLDYGILVFSGVLLPIGLLSGGLTSREAQYRKLANLFHNTEMPMREFMAHVACHSQIDPEKILLHTNRLAKQHLFTSVGDLFGLVDTDWHRLELPLKLELAMKRELYDEEHCSQKKKMLPEEQEKIASEIVRLQSVKQEPVAM